MRSRNSLLNVISVILMQASSLIIGLVARRVFLDYLPVELLGVSGLFNSFFYSIGLIDIGFASILIYNLYKPISENNHNEVIKNVAIFKKIYFTIGGIIFAISMCALPFINHIFIIDYDNQIVVYMIYIIQLLTTVMKYFFIHKANILIVDQKRFVINFITIGIDLVFFIFKMISIAVFHSYVIYLWVLFGYNLVLNLLNLIITNKTYPYLKKLPKVSYKEVLDTGALKQSGNYIFRTIYDFVYYSTDNFIISIKMGTYSIAFLDNYTMIFNIFDTFLSQIISSLRDSFANFLHVEKNIEGLYGAYKMMNLMNFLFVSFTATGLFTLIDLFISLWLGTRFIIDFKLMLILLVNLVLDLLFRPIENIFTIKGYVFKEKLPLFISALTNLILSWILIDYWGLFGIFFGTFIGKIIFWCGKLFYVGNDVFFEFRTDLIFTQIRYIFLIIAQSLITLYIVNLLPIQGITILDFICKAVIVVVIVALMDILIFFKNKDFRQLISLGINTVINLSKERRN